MNQPDKTRCDVLAADIADALKRHYGSADPSPSNVYEALQALALMTAAIVLGAEGELLDWFLTEFSKAMDDLRSTTKKATLQ